MHLLSSTGSKRVSRLLIFLGMLLSLPAHSSWALPAFPGAQGAGADAVGGRGGDVYYVTSLADSGPGSLREGITSAAGPRTILFNVSGNILLTSDLNIDKSFLTIAGQTAPGDGITFQGRQVGVYGCHDVVVRFIRSRPGDLDCPDFQGDAFHFLEATNCIADHVSASWSIDEVLSCTLSTQISVQWCLITEALNDACHVKGPHGYGSLLRYGDGGISFHHNLYAHHRARNPLLGDGLKLDFVNNVIYDWGAVASHSVEEDSSTNIVNYVGNYLVAGPSTTKDLTTAFRSGVTNAAQCEIYQSGNFIDGNRNGILDAENTGWDMFAASCTQRTNRYPLPEVGTDVARLAYERVLTLAGARSPRDPVDTRVVRTVLDQAGAIIDSQDAVGGFPILNGTAAPADGDSDGIPDYWEQAMGWDIGMPNNNHVNPDGYTDLEWHLNHMAEFHVVCERNGFVEMDLRDWTRGFTNLNFWIGDPTNGTVSLLGDGHTALFVSPPNFSGIGGFTFNPSRFGPAFGIGPIPVRVLVAATNQAVVPPAVHITHPTNAAVLDPDLEIQLSAVVTGSSGTVTNVEFYAGTAEPLGRVGDDATAPYEMAWTSPLVGGEHTIRVVAHDDQGLSAVDSIQVSVTPAEIRVSTFEGDGADVEMREQYDDSNNGAAINTRTSSLGDRNEVIGLRFDLAGYSLSEITNVSLNVTSYRNDTGTRVVNLCGVEPGTSASQGSFTAENWDEAGLATFGSLPGLLPTDGDYLTQSLDTNQLTWLGQITVPANSGEGVVRTFDQPALTSFVRAHSGNEKLMFLLAAGDGGSGQFRVASKEATQLATPGLFTGPPGTFSPYVSFVVVGAAPAPRLNHLLTNAGAGIELSWTGPGELQYQVDSLDQGLSSGWMAYPETNNPLTVPIDRSQPTTWFRVSRLP